ncbi:MAG: hypothetical protein JOZ11_19155, partial [Alphaproteobacteria bacterium]|nr:hypothetical protein [Alphaproteobacteria bacterium]
MSDTIHGKPGVANRPSADKEVPLPLRRRGKGKMPAAKGWEKEAVPSKPDDVSAPPPGPTPPSPAAKVRKAGSEPLPDAAELSKQIAEIAGKSQQLVAEFLKRQGREEGVGMADPLGIGTAFLEMTARMMADPSRLVQAQLSLWNDYLTLWQRTTQRFLGGDTEPMIEP